MASLYFRYGAMGAGKSLDLIKVYCNYRDRAMTAVALTPMMGTRGVRQIIESRAGTYPVDCLTFSEADDIGYVLPLKQLNAILVDEAQFLTTAQVIQLAEIVDNQNIPVICYGLRTDYRGELFEGAAALFALADKIEELKTICWCGKKATDNMLVVDGEAVYTGQQVVIDDDKLKGTYHAVCRKHWREGEWK